MWQDRTINRLVKTAIIINEFVSYLFLSRDYSLLFVSHRRQIDDVSCPSNKQRKKDHTLVLVCRKAITRYFSLWWVSFSSIVFFDDQKYCTRLITPRLSDIEKYINLKYIYVYACEFVYVYVCMSCVFSVYIFIYIYVAKYNIYIYAIYIYIYYIYL